MARKDVLEARAAQGGRQISASFTAAELDLLDRCKRLYPRASQKEIIVEALKALEARKNALQWADVRAWLDDHLDDSGNTR